jgi:hypothetical protein
MKCYAKRPGGCSHPIICKVMGCAVKEDGRPRADLPACMMPDGADPCDAFTLVQRQRDDNHAALQTLSGALRSAWNRLADHMTEIDEECLRAALKDADKTLYPDDPPTVRAARAPWAKWDDDKNEPAF